MPCNTYKNIGDVVKEFQITYTEENFITPIEINVSDYFKADLEFTLREGEGWGQCLAELIAAQNINHAPEKTVFGIVSNGEIWEFGKLSLDVFTKNIKLYTIQSLDELLAAIAYIFDQSKSQLID